MHREERGYKDVGTIAASGALGRTLRAAEKYAIDPAEFAIMANSDSQDTRKWSTPATIAGHKEVVETMEEYNTELWTAAAESWRMLAEGDGEAAGRSQLLEPFIPRAIVEGQPPVIMYHLPAW